MPVTIKSLDDDGMDAIAVQEGSEGDPSRCCKADIISVQCHRKMDGGIDRASHSNLAPIPWQPTAHEE